eukprot:521713_1
MLNGLSIEIQRDDFAFIDSWKEYSFQSHDENKIYQQLDNLLDIAYEMHKYPLPIQKYIKLCPHTEFEDQNTLIQIMINYCCNKQSAAKQLNSLLHSEISFKEKIKYRLCNNCIHKFIIKTNGLNDIFLRWTDNIEEPKQLRFRFEFNNTNIIITDQPLFLRTILKNNTYLSKIFKLFFITYLKEIDLNQYIIQNQTQITDPIRIWRVPHSGHKFDIAIHNNTINICHGLEHSLCSLSTIILILIPLLCTRNIKHLFIDDSELSCIAEIINDFLRNYCNLPHIQLHRENSIVLEKVFNGYENQPNYQTWKNKIKNDKTFAKYWPYKLANGQPIYYIKKEMHSNDIYNALIATKHPFLQRLIHIISALYEQIIETAKRLKKHNDASWKQFNFLRNTFDGYISKNAHNSDNIQDLNTEIILFGDYEDHIWQLIPCFLDGSMPNKDYKMRYKQKYRCGGCNKLQTKWPKRKFKLCSYCKLSYYCSRKCQKYDWSRNNHHKVCFELTQSVVA